MSTEEICFLLALWLVCREFHTFFSRRFISSLKLQVSTLKQHVATLEQHNELLRERIKTHDALMRKCISTDDIKDLEALLAMEQWEEAEELAETILCAGGISESDRSYVESMLTESEREQFE